MATFMATPIKLELSEEIKSFSPAPSLSISQISLSPSLGCSIKSTLRPPTRAPSSKLPVAWPPTSGPGPSPVNYRQPSADSIETRRRPRIGSLQLERNFGPKFATANLLTSVGILPAKVPSLRPQFHSGL